ncbi:hypothetical protein [Pseudomonas mediterranea]|uniref:hypothetical protein n=1 Tax=Pseudomonas mediterranea TaxID=183795 RepID=UPI0006D8994F|nr:hypothetical protein [Pseudomonas mediterranea]
MGNVKSGTEAYPGWVPGPNPFGNQRASDCETWYRIEGVCQYEIRMDYYTDLWQINKAYNTAPKSNSYARPNWGSWRQATDQEFADPVSAMLWFELNKADL